MTLNQNITRRFLAELLSTDAGRAFVLNQIVDAEAWGEGRLFDRVLARVSDPQLMRLIRRHRDDKLRHAQLFIERLESAGSAPRPVPRERSYVTRLDAAVGGLRDRALRDARDVMEAYLFQQVLEERAIVQFEALEAAFRPHDAATADVIAAVLLDEERHLRWCRTIAIRYAPDEWTLRETLARFRDVEARVFRAQELAVTRYALDRGFVGGAFWRALLALGRAQRASPTPFAEQLPNPFAA
jgi:hypothetical protein